MLITALSGITLTTSLALLLRGYYEGTDSIWTTQDINLMMVKVIP